MTPTPVTSTPVSSPSTGRYATSRECGSDECMVRPLLSTEPGSDSRRHDRANGPVTDSVPVAVPVPDPEHAVPVPARRAAHALVIMALEVVDRKRTPRNTRGAFPPHLIEMLGTVARGGVPGRALGVARIHRLHIHPADPGGADSSGAPGSPGGGGRDYEVCATYARGPRLFAVAARIRVTDTGATCTALRLV
ncbi:hypothetical protein [Dietzia sp. UCD-THP]|uniref:hypothetical protein n=1 Tax=Dietzia sp. UCD-THP TaxID=1292020 RepID=UPI00187CCD53|nr:hypothetical protein [Dietzia sp. UCD-THP]